MTHIINQSFHGFVFNAFRNIYTNAKRELYLTHAKAFKSRKLEQGEELTTILDGQRDLEWMDPVEFSHKDKCKEMWHLENDWEKRREDPSDDGGDSNIDEHKGRKVVVNSEQSDEHLLHKNWHPLLNSTSPLFSKIIEHST